MSVIDEGTELGARTARHLREEVVVWLTTVTAAGAPLPRPVWFLWDGADVVSVYSLPGARVRNIERNPRVTLNFGGDGRGGDIVVDRQCRPHASRHKNFDVLMQRPARHSREWRFAGFPS